MRNVTINHHISQALNAHVIMKRDVDYVVQDDEVVIVDEFTGRLMAGRRYSDGLAPGDRSERTARRFRTRA